MLRLLISSAALVHLKITPCPVDRNLSQDHIISCILSSRGATEALGIETAYLNVRIAGTRRHQAHDCDITTTFQAHCQAAGSTRGSVPVAVTSHARRPARAASSLDPCASPQAAGSTCFAAALRLLPSADVAMTLAAAGCSTALGGVAGLRMRCASMSVKARCQRRSVLVGVGAGSWPHGGCARYSTATARSTQHLAAP